jgi:hypothetical protein
MVTCQLLIGPCDELVRLGNLQNDKESPGLAGDPSSDA